MKFQDGRPPVDADVAVFTLGVLAEVVEDGLAEVWGVMLKPIGEAQYVLLRAVGWKPDPREIVKFLEWRFDHERADFHIFRGVVLQYGLVEGGRERLREMFKRQKGKGEDDAELEWRP
jgi:hypothetical protein